MKCRSRGLKIEVVGDGIDWYALRDESVYRKAPMLDHFVGALTAWGDWNCRISFHLNDLTFMLNSSTDCRSTEKGIAL